MQFVEEKTEGRLLLGAGSLYGALESLNKKGWIAVYGNSDTRKKEYVITEEGKSVAKRELERIKSLLDVASEIMGG